MFSFDKRRLLAAIGIAIAAGGAGSGCAVGRGASTTGSAPFIASAEDDGGGYWEEGDSVGRGPRWRRYFWRRGDGGGLYDSADPAALGSTLGGSDGALALTNGAAGVRPLYMVGNLAALGGGLTGGVLSTTSQLGNTVAGAAGPLLASVTATGAGALGDVAGVTDGVLSGTAGALSGAGGINPALIANPSAGSVLGAAIATQTTVNNNGRPITGGGSGGVSIGAGGTVVSAGVAGTGVSSQGTGITVNAGAGNLAAGLGVTVGAPSAGLGGLVGVTTSTTTPNGAGSGLLGR